MHAHTGGQADRQAGGRAGRLAGRQAGRQALINLSINHPTGDGNGFTAVMACGV